MQLSKRRPAQPDSLTKNLTGTGKLPVLLCLLALLMLSMVLGACISRDNEAGNAASNTAVEPEGPPVSWDDQSDRDWLHRSQYKTHMRHMWLDSNRIVSAARGDMEPTWHEIHAGAADIENRAKLIGGFWRDIATAIEDMQWAVEDEDRIGVTEEFKKMGFACDGCHMSTWSPAYLHVTEGIIGRWNKNFPTEHEPNEVDIDPPPVIPNREAMQKLWFEYQMIELRIQKWQLEDLTKQLESMAPEVTKRAERWENVAKQAGAIRELADKRKKSGMKEAYGLMTATCLACHAENAGATREILIPMPWDGPVK